MFSPTHPSRYTVIRTMILLGVLIYNFRLSCDVLYPYVCIIIVIAAQCLKDLLGVTDLRTLQCEYGDLVLSQVTLIVEI